MSRVPGTERPGGYLAGKPGQLQNGWGVTGQHWGQNEARIWSTIGIQSALLRWPRGTATLQNKLCYQTLYATITWMQSSASLLPPRSGALPLPPRSGPWRLRAQRASASEFALLTAEAFPSVCVCGARERRRRDLERRARLEPTHSSVASKHSHLRRTKVPRSSAPNDLIENQPLCCCVHLLWGCPVCHSTEFAHFHLKLRTMLHPAIRLLHDTICQTGGFAVIYFGEQRYTQNTVICCKYHGILHYCNTTPA